MARRAQHTHLIKEKNDLGFYAGTTTPRVEYVFYCGERDTTRVDRSTEDPMRASCPGCARYAGKLKLAEAGADLKIVPWEDTNPRKKGWKSANYATLNGEPFAHILFDTGYGGKWMIRSLHVDQTTGETLVGQKPDPAVEPYTVTVDGVDKQANRTYVDTAHSKEMALFQAYKQFLAGKLPSLTQARESAENAKKAAAERAERWRLSEEKAAQDKADLIEALEGIRAKAEAKAIDLTNYEVDSLMKAIAIVKEART
ncbi:hypothetical protein HOU03_gp413 [Caulobacter phage CcrSC]|uniref:Uncharacterized protein n=1 Tax=Caulobacter phage CcrSC TaxID=2283272 RepID=A0A385EFP4_9CAUD|nr:hypothetical protein HOU03_gp413 [Caulobacter phage CcrSC]AXQ69855.1 hypothetical protein CcrSC_gp273c [Caulobacter phage CcrSC]